VSLDHHLETQHDVFRSKVLDLDLLLGEGREEYTYETQRHTDGLYYCPVLECGATAKTPWSLRRHFAMRHPTDLVHTPEEHFPRCALCGMQTNPEVIGRGHESTALCKWGQKCKQQYAAVTEATRALDQRFTAYGEELERVETFKYLGRLMAQDDSDIQAVLANLRKARKVWAQISRVRRLENAEPRVCGMFYKATVQAELLFGSETWNVLTAMLARLEGFHIRAAYRMVRNNKPLRNAGGWEYPSSGDVLKEVGLYPVEHYIRVRRDTIAAYIMHQPIFDDCRGR